MEIIEKRSYVRMTGEHGESVSVRETNRGEPYRHGIEVSLEAGNDYLGGVFLELGEAAHFRDLLNRIVPKRERRDIGDEDVVTRALDALKNVRSPDQMALWINGYAVPLCQRIRDLEGCEDAPLDILAYRVGPDA